MIEEPPLLTIKRPDRRPTAEQIAAFQGVPTSFVVDALQGGHTLASNIRPIGESRHINCVAAGPALTVETGPADILALLAALPHIQPGDIVVSSFDGHQGCATIGDRVSAMAKNSGAIGFVTDGPARDYVGIVEVGLPIWCVGLCPNTPHQSGPGKVGLPISIGGCRVETGDIVVADFDGVVVVPYIRIEEVIAELSRIIELEKAEEISDETAPAVIKALLETDKVKYV